MNFLENFTNYANLVPVTVFFANLDLVQLINSLRKKAKVALEFG
ncbi:MAG: hypothetical protein K0Q74_483 [Gammaproteobacteria bacterium]|jgi:hypothetical protein|nr:hypothetical protein [Gammaproteobacteria bacterium]